MTTDSNINFDDAQLMQKVAMGDVSAFERLYKKYFPIVLSYLTSLNGFPSSSDYLTQEVFVRYWKNKGSFKGKSSAKTYLFGIAKNVILEEQKSTLKRKTLLKGLIQHSRNKKTDHLRNDHSLELHKKFEQAVSRLSHKQKQAFQLFHVEGLSLRDAARKCSCSIDAFEGRLCRARKELLKLINQTII